jgi:hypothetical protein
MGGVSGMTIAPDGDTMPMSGLFVYGIVDRDADCLYPPGIGGAPVRAVGCRAGVAALASDAGAVAPTLSMGDGELVPASLEAAVRAHESVLEEALPYGVVPFRFGSVVQESDLVAYLESTGVILAAELERLRRRSEWSVVATWDRKAAEAYVASEQRESLSATRTPAGGAGRAYLMARQRSQVERNALEMFRARCASRLYRALRLVARDAVLRAAVTQQDAGGAHRETLLDGCFLVENAEQEAFSARIETELARGFSVKLAASLTGPWPAYHFTRTDIGVSA